MSLLNRLKKSKNTLTLNVLIQEEYQQNYLDECKFIWNHYVPKQGQSDVLQGELLRQLEQLRCQAQDSGNINWDSDFAYFCDFIKETLCSFDIFSIIDQEKISFILDYLKECGQYAARWRSGAIPDDQVDMNRIAYTEDNLYDRIADAIGFLQANIPEPIPFEKNDEIMR